MQDKHHHISVIASAADVEMQKLAKRLQLPVSHTSLDTDGFALFMSDNLLSLRTTPSNENTMINVNFSSAAFTYRRELGGGKNQPLGKAVGLNKKTDLVVIDATAGMGKDAFVLAGLGCHVTMLERSTIVGALLEDGLRRGKEDEVIRSIIEKMNLKIVNSCEYLASSLCKSNPPDVIYLDPMYPHRKKSAKVKKEMQILQQLLGHDDDLSQLLDVALNCAKNRVVVKRPKGAEHLSEQIPTHSIESKKTRYDVYMQL